MMKPALRAASNCIGATTLDEYRQYISTGLDVFAPVFVEEPTVEQTIDVAWPRVTRGPSQGHLPDEALVAAARLSHRYVTERKLPDKAIDLMDEAASKLRVALYSMPDALKELKKRLDRLAVEEEEASLNTEYERAMKIKAQRLQLVQEYEQEVERWQHEHTLDEVVDADDIAEVVAQWTGIPVNQMLETEADKLLRMEEVLHKRDHRPGGGGLRPRRRHPPRAQRPERPAPSDRLVHLPGQQRRGQDRAG